MPRITAPSGSTLSVAAGLAGAAIVTALLTGASSTRFQHDLDQAGPPLSLQPAFSPPSSATTTNPGDLPPRRLSQRVVLVILDGLREDASHGQPFLDSLRARGTSGSARAAFPSLSLPGYTSILTGAPPRWSGVRSNSYDHAVPLDSIVARVRSAGGRAVFVGDHGRSVPRLLPDFADATLAPWSRGLERSLITALERPADLVVVLWSGIDDAGHDHGAASPAYRAAVGSADRALARALASLDPRTDTILVVADHGHIASGGHGGTEPEVLAVPLLLAGAGVRRGGSLDHPMLTDVAPTVAALLGLPAPGHALGRTQTGALALGARERAARARLDHDRQTALLPALHAAEAQARRAATRGRALRWLALALALAAALAGLAWATRQGLLRLDRRVVAASLATVPVLLFALLASCDRSLLSPSLLPHPESLLRKLLPYVALAITIQAALAWYAAARRRSPRGRLAAASGAAALGLLVALLPAAVVWAMVGGDSAYTACAPVLNLLSPLCNGAACLAAAVASAVLGLETVIYLARSSVFVTGSSPGQDRAASDVV